MARYQIDIQFMDDYPKVWHTFYSAKTCHTEKAARKEWWKWVCYPFDDNERILFRIWDTKKNRAVQL